MRRWIANLHGGQLIMLLAFLLLLSGIPGWMGNFLVTSANTQYSFANETDIGNAMVGIKPDTAAATRIRHIAGDTASLGFRWYAGMFALWVVCLWMLWVWFGARRRNAIVAEIVEPSP